MYLFLLKWSNLLTEYGGTELRIISIEPTPSPNVMKCTIDTPLTAGKRYEYTKATSEYAPGHLQKILAIEEIMSVFQVLDFISIERHPKADWGVILSKVKAVFGEDISAESAPTSHDSYGEVHVFVQTLRGIPYQLKLTQENAEKRFALPDKFQQAVMNIQGVTSNVILERTWMDQGIRYGTPEELGEQLIEEYKAMYSEERLAKMVKHAQNAKEPAPLEQKPTTNEVRETLQKSNWQDRYAILSQWEPTIDDLDLIDLAIHDPVTTIRRQAVVLLSYIGGSRVLPYLFKAMNDSSAIIRRTAGDTLSDIGDPKAIPVMCKAIFDKNKLVRWRAARFLYEVGDDTAIPALQEAIHDPEFEVKMQAQIALERIERGEAASGTVWQQMKQEIKGNNEK